MSSIFETVFKIIKILESEGHPSYIVGGALRDYYIKLKTTNINFKEALEKAKDIDICSSAKPEEILKLFEKTFLTGAKFGTVTILMDGYSFEHTTFRNDLYYPENSRKPVISFSKNIKDDLSRRDFTMNALAMDSSGNVIDCYGGIDDINKSVIRSVGEPEKRFKEDPLRKLRAIRFAAEKGFDLDENIEKSIKNNSSLKGISLERIKPEIEKILISKNPEKGIDLMRKTGLLAEILPEIISTIGFSQKNPHHQYTVYEHICRVISNTPEDKILRWAALFHDISKPECFFIGEDGYGHFYGHEKKGSEVADKIMRRLKFSNEDRIKIKNIVYLHGRHPELKKSSVRRWMAKLINIYGISPYLMMEFFKADHNGKKEKAEDNTYFNNLFGLVEEIMNENKVFSRADLSITGNDLIKELKIADDKRKYLKQVFEELVNICIENPEQNQRDILIKSAGEILSKIIKKQS